MGVNPDGSARFSQPFAVRLKLGISLTITPGAALWLNYDERDELVITGGDSAAQEQQGINPIQQNPLDPYAHGSVNQTQLLTLLATSTTPPSDQIYVKPWVIYADGTLDIFPGTLTGPLSSVIPGAGLHRALAVGVLSDYSDLDWAVGTIKQTIDPLDITDYREAIGSLSADSIPAWIYRLHDDQTQILDADRWLDVRQIVNVPTSSGGGAASGSYVTTTPVADSDNVIQPSAAAVTPLTVKGAAAQSDPLTDWVDSIGSLLARLDSGGNLLPNALYASWTSASTGLLSDAFAVSRGYHVLSAESSTSDNLATIYGGAAGYIIVLQAASGHTITVKHGAGNIYLSGAADYTLSGSKKLLLMRDGTNWADVSVPGSTAGATIDVTGTAGENLATRDAVYQSPTDAKWYKIDIDATATVKCGTNRGFATAAISANASGTIRTAGPLTGFSSLTAGDDVWATTTAGAITQAKPTLTAGGGQRAIVRLGYASATDTVIIEKLPVQYLKRENLSNNATTTIEHHTDENARSRACRAYVSTDVGRLVADYATTNQDTAVHLRGPNTGSGSTTTISTTADSQPIGDSGGTEWWWGQSFQVTAGILTQFTFDLTANQNTPAGTITWEICADSSGAPGSVLVAGTIAPTASATNTVALADGGPYLAASTTYWLVLKPTTDQSTDNAWRWRSSTSSIYANGNASASTNGGSSWSAQTIDMASTYTTSAVANKDRLAQSFQIDSAATLDLVKLYLRKWGSPSGTLTLRVETDSSGSPSGTLVNANATVDVAESGLGTSLALVDFDFSTNFPLSGSTPYWLVLSTTRSASASDYVVWGADSSPGYASGEMKSDNSGWSAESKDACFEVYAESTTYEEPCVIGRASGGTRDVGVRLDDGAGADGNIKTTFKNVIGSTADITCVVELP